MQEKGISMLFIQSENGEWFNFEYAARMVKRGQKQLDIWFSNGSAHRFEGDVEKVEKLISAVTERKMEAVNGRNTVPSEDDGASVQSKKRRRSAPEVSEPTEDSD